MTDTTKGSAPARPVRPIATKGERDALIAGRPKPVVEHHLTPGGQTEVTVKQRIEAARESRITEIQNAFSSAQKNLRQDRAKAMVRGRAKVDFDRSR
ncbi:hypothetical protein [Roseibium sp.]|uniref:hypothetical protein n=1 Tax=Roseibium sp. TaxID=1936156 RepID=UPI003A983796